MGKQALNVETDMIDGKSLKESAKDRLKEGIKTFASQREAIKQSGSGVRRKRHRLRRVARRVRRERLILSINMAFVHDQSCECAKSELVCFQYLSLRLA